MSEKGLLEVKGSSDNTHKEYHLNETLYPVLRDVLEEVFGKEYIRCYFRSEVLNDKEFNFIEQYIGFSDDDAYHSLKDDLPVLKTLSA